MEYHSRSLEKVLVERLTQFPVVAVTGPRQSGKTTLVKRVLPDWKYVTLEDHDQRMSATDDPRGFLRMWGPGTIIDEFQRSPELTSYLQGVVDEQDRNGLFVLTGSQSYVLHEQIAQSLAGRVGLLVLHPFSYSELPAAAPEADVWETVYKGGFPRVALNRVPPEVWFPSFVSTYVEKDVRQMLAVRQLEEFQLFVKLLAARAGQLVNHASVSRDCGVSVPTVRQWLSVLEAGYLVMRLPPSFSNNRKRLVKTPKLHFTDSGLLCHLLGIHSPEELAGHPARGAVFENWVLTEVMKAATHGGWNPTLAFWRDSDGNEVDIIAIVRGRTVAIEAKGAETMRRSHLKGLRRFQRCESASTTDLLVYAGRQPLSMDSVRGVPWNQIDRTLQTVW
jgi:uncharacterized protein